MFTAVVEFIKWVGDKIWFCRTGWRPGVRHILILDMYNKATKKRLYTEPKDSPNEALRSVVVFQGTIKKKTSYDR